MSTRQDSKQGSTRHTPPRPQVLTSPLFESHGIVHGFSTRIGGVSLGPYASCDLGGSAKDDPEGYAQNLALFAGALGLEAGEIATASQVHGNTVLEVLRGGAGFEFSGDTSEALSPDSDGSDGDAKGTQPVSEAPKNPPDPQPPALPEADALIAHLGLAVGVRTADCVPILLFDLHSRLAAAIHAGWRGTVARIASRAVSALRLAAGGEKSEIVAAIGPCIGRCCFEVSPELGQRFAEDPEFGPAVVDHDLGTRPHIDLVGANYRQLLNSGLPPKSIDRLNRCTMCEPETFFSHRRDQGLTGRQLSVIVAR